MWLSDEMFILPQNFWISKNDAYVADTTILSAKIGSYKHYKKPVFG